MAHALLNAEATGGVTLGPCRPSKPGGRGYKVKRSWSRYHATMEWQGMKETEAKFNRGAKALKYYIYET